MRTETLFFHKERQSGMYSFGRREGWASSMALWKHRFNVEYKDGQYTLQERINLRIHINT